MVSDYDCERDVLAGGECLSYEQIQRGFDSLIPYAPLVNWSITECSGHSIRRSKRRRGAMDTWIIENVRVVRKPRRKKGLGLNMPLYRASKIMVHTTVNGVGVVERLRKKK